MKHGMRGLAASAWLAVCAVLAGCAGGVAGNAPGSQASDGSGVTVFGTIDTNVGHTRTSR